MFIHKCMMALAIVSASMFCSSTAQAAQQQNIQMHLAAPLAAGPLPLCQALDILSGYKSHQFVGEGGNEQYRGLLYVVAPVKDCVFNIPFNPAIVSIYQAQKLIKPAFDAQTSTYYYQAEPFHFYRYTLLVPNTQLYYIADNRCPFPAFC